MLERIRTQHAGLHTWEIPSVKGHGTTADAHRRDNVLTNKSLEKIRADHGRTARIWYQDISAPGHFGTWTLRHHLGRFVTWPKRLGTLHRTVRHLTQDSSAPSRQDGSAPGQPDTLL
ncbi:hypothetical protein Bbelb_367440 [Branchiostoma belcheri]|nr:hypothetical protein Bbelb_367440 [Branchiostoma belcheri]